MSSRSYLYACSSRDEAEAQQHLNNSCWIMKWTIPIFWYACFDPGDEITITPPDEALFAYPALLASIAQISQRLTRRKDKVIQLLPDELQTGYGELYDAFSEQLREDFSEFVLLDIGDLFALLEGDESVMSGWTGEIKLFADMADGDAARELADFAIANAINLGEPAGRYEMQNIPADVLAIDWRRLAVGGPKGSTEFPPYPHDSELSYAAEVIEKFELKSDQDIPAEIDIPTGFSVEEIDENMNKNPWWKFWK